MDPKRIRLDQNFTSISVSQNLNQSHVSQVLLDLKIWQNIQISKCIDDNYINRLLETTRSVIADQSNDEAQFVQQQQQILESEAINTAITSYGLKKQPIFSDDESSSELPCCSSSSSSLSISSYNNSSNLEDIAINSAINNYGLHKNV